MHCSCLADALQYENMAYCGLNNNNFWFSGVVVHLINLSSAVAYKIIFLEKIKLNKTSPKIVGTSYNQNNGMTKTLNHGMALILQYIYAIQLFIKYLSAMQI